MEEVIVRCGADDSASFSWASLREVDFSHNSISQLGDSLVCPLVCVCDVCLPENGYSMYLSVHVQYSIHVGSSLV